MAHPRFLKYRDVDRSYRFSVSAISGAVLFVSKGYRTRSQRDQGMEHLRTHYGNRRNYQLDITEMGYSVFHFKYSRYGRIGTSMLYNSMSERDAGMKRFVNSVAVAGVEEG